MIQNERTLRVLSQITQEEWEAILIIARDRLKGQQQYLDNEENINEKELRIKAINLLREIGMVPQHLGYTYLEEAIILIYKDNKYTKNISHNLYPAIAKKFGTTKSRIERSIRHAIGYAFSTESTEVREKVFRGVKFGVNEIPTNSHAIAAITEYFRLYCV